MSGNGLTRKFKPILDVLSRTFLSNYSPSQELSIDEAMISTKVISGVKSACQISLQRRVSKCGVVAVLAVVISTHFKFMKEST